MSNGLDEILEDAKVVALYGQRAGRLRSGELFEAIAAFEGLPAPRSWSAPETVVLQKALNQAVAEIAPTTLADIRRKDPFAPKDKKDIVKRASLIAFSILLMVITAGFTTLYNTGSELAILLEDIDRSEPAEKMAAIARQWNSAKADAAANETYFRMLDDLRELDEQVLGYLSGYTSFRQSVRAWTPWSYFNSDEVPTAPTEANRSAKPYPQVSCGAASGEPAPALVDEFVRDPPGLILRQNKNLIINFACAESLSITPYTMPQLVAGGAYIREVLKLLGFWVLPGLYGALGATIFFMRAVLNPVLPDPQIDQMIHRVALGGFAGIIFAWFWAPSLDTPQQFAGLTINSFVIAFVIGFSIDVFFTLLDRLVTFLQGVASQSGDTRLATAVGPAIAVSAPPLTRDGRPAVPVAGSISPITVERGPAPATFSIEGANLEHTRDVVMTNGAAGVNATDVVASANAVDFQAVFTETDAAGTWTVELSDEAGRSTAAPSVAVT